MDTLYHHGILGMHWGKKNGPPYPLDFNKLSAEERLKAKEETIRKGDIVTASKNKSHYTNQELNDVVNRFTLNEKVNTLSEAKIARGKKGYKELSDGIQKYNDIVTKLANGINGSTKAYNAIAKVANSLGDKKLPLIGEEANKEVNKQTKTVTINEVSGTQTVTIRDSHGNAKTVTKKL